MIVHSLKSSRRVALLFAGVLVLLGILVGASLPARAAGPVDAESAGSDLLTVNQDLLVYPPGSRPFLKPYGIWGGEWWKWMGQFPLADSPITDPDGSRGGAAYQPAGRVWYLAGTFGGPGERWLEVPYGNGVLAPLINSDIWSPEDCWWIGASQSPDACTAGDLQAYLDGFYTQNVTDLWASIDGQELTNLFAYRARSGPFTLLLGPDSLWTDFGYTPGPRYPNNSDGYYLMLKPLPRGQHEITFGAAVDWDLDGASEVAQDMTYHLTIQ